MNNKLFRILASSLLVFSFIFSVTACNRTPERTERETEEETEESEDDDFIGTRLHSDVKVTEETNVKTSETEVTSSETSVTTEATTEETTQNTSDTLPMAELDRNDATQFFPSWAENRAGVRVTGTTQCRSAVIADASTYKDFEDNAVVYKEEMLSHPNAILIYVFDDINCTDVIAAYMRDDSFPEDTGDYYYFELDGVKFPNGDNLAVFEGCRSLLYEIRDYQLFVDSDFIPDENGVIHGFIYVTNRISEYETNYTFGNEIDVNNLVQLNEWVLAMGLAEPDLDYQGEYAEIYMQYPSLPSDYQGYPLGLCQYWNLGCFGYEYNPGLDYSNRMWMAYYS